MLRALLLKLAASKSLAQFATRNAVAWKFARRFVAGETMDDAIAVARELNAEGIMVTLDFLGENVSEMREAQVVQRTYLELLRRIECEKVEANVSLKLSQFGLDVDRRECISLLEHLVCEAGKHGSFVRIDMESSAYTERTLNIVRHLRRDNSAVGVVVQAYLHRSRRDVAALIAGNCRIRLCKGAYKEPPSEALQSKVEVDANYLLLMRRLLSSGAYHGIATHDPKMIDATIDYADSLKLPKDRFEFQMLYGIRRDLQRDLVKRGYRVRVYVPFGSKWYPYFMRRLAERPANVWFFIRNIFK